MPSGLEATQFTEIFKKSAIKKCLKTLLEAEIIFQKKVIMIHEFMKSLNN